MKITNTTRLPKQFLVALTKWVRAECFPKGNAPRYSFTVAFRRCADTLAGAVTAKIWHQQRLLANIAVYITPAKDDEYEFDRVLRIVIHLAGAFSSCGGVPHPTGELGVWRHPILKTFTDQHATLIPQWLAQVPKPDLNAKQRERVLICKKRVKVWQRKEALAKTKLKQWTRRLGAATTALKKRMIHHAE